MSNPFFSVIVPAHNSAGYIEKGLHSIRQQSFKDYELIVVCDRCTDNTASIALNYADKVLIRDYGLDGMARNAGIDAAEGQYLLFMDDDDWFLHEFVFHQLAARIGETSPDILLFSFIWKTRGYINQLRNRVIAVWAKCWRRDAIGSTRFPDTPYWSDVGFDKQMFSKPLCAERWDMPIYYYNYLREGSISWRQAHGEIK